MNEVVNRIKEILEEKNYVDVVGGKTGQKFKYRY